MAAAMAIINFGDFDKMQKYFGANLERAKKLDNYLVNTSISDFMLEVMPSCHEFFENKCWWMNHYFNCCSLFELQKTEYGFCYTFNSELSERNNMGIGNYDHGEGPDNLRPYRTSTAGRWGGLKFTINLPPEQIPPIMKDFIPGIVIVVSSPYDFPITGSDVPAVGSVQVVLSAEVTKATSQVQSLPPARRKCMYHDEGPQLGFPEYRHANCRAQCHRASAYQYCNCTPYFFPNEDIFNYDKPQPDNPFFYDGQQGISCFCSEDCNRMEYTSDIYAVPVLK
ncbi:hypothetical protein C0J52_23710 [Blattella germanica]|nr:hypothetical protein C0J52_23710 [Blattella germanica]